MSQTNFIELNADELNDVNGGNPVLIGIGIGLIGSAIYDTADQMVENTTGKHISEHLFEGLEAAGDYLFG